MNRTISALLAIAASSVTLHLAADEDLEAAAIAIQGRQANLRDLGAAYKAVTDELKKAQPSLPVIRQYAAQIDDLAKQQGYWYPPGSGPESEIETDARAEIWTRPEEFAKAADRMTQQAARLRELAASDDVPSIKAQHQALGKACKQCHDRFRKE